MRVAICIVGFRNTTDVVRCVGAVAELVHQDFEVIVCENGGDEAFAALRAQLPASLPGGQSLTLISAPENPGFAGGNNLAIAAARAPADAWWILNPDTVPSPEALGLMCERLTAGPFGAVGCTVHYADGRVESRGGVWKPWLARAESLEHGKRLSEPVDNARVEANLNYLNGASMLVSDAFLKTVGPMREEYFLYAEEVEWCLRGLEFGQRLGMAASANVLHFKGSTTGSIQDVGSRSKIAIFLDERNKVLLTRDRFPKLLPFAAVAAFVLIFLRFARRRAWPQVGFALQGWWAGLQNQRGKPAWS